ncbi:hypothetical protein, partial [Pseudomonas sp. FW215-T2]|uniref:hypothetical protein n=1 Tax=Pseudomonas sp. FW215-T2 TaxID=2070672 RepID=UPI001A92BABD
MFFYKNVLTLDKTVIYQNQCAMTGEMTGDWHPLLGVDIPVFRCQNKGQAHSGALAFTAVE